MIRRLFFVFLLFSFVFPVLAVNAQGVSLVAQTQEAAPSVWGLIDRSDLTVLVLLAVIVVFLIAFIRQSGMVKDSIPPEVIKAIVDVVVDVTKRTPTTLDDMVAEDILRPLVERILMDWEAQKVAPPGDNPPAVG
jgi:hypothetical protein